jgi:glycosyltransferase involved in cell wall biosynthesis
MKDEKKTLAIDIRDLTPSMGMGIYLENILKEFSSYPDYRVILLSDDDIPEQFSRFASATRVMRSYSQTAWERFMAPSQIIKDRCHIYFNTRNLGLIRIRPVPCVVTVFDVIPLLFDDFAAGRKSYRQRLSYTARRADRIIVISSTTKNDIIKFYPDAKEKTDAFYLGIEDLFMKDNDIGRRNNFLSRNNLRKGYLLYVGSFAHQKNFITALKTLNGLKNRVKSATLAAVGQKRTLKKEDAAYIEKNKLEGSIVFLQDVDRNDLPFVYDGASVLLFPSFYEGFGLPVLEACARSLPVIAYPSPSVKEICGESVSYAEKEEAWINMTYEIMTASDSQIKALTEKQKTLLSRYSWKETARRTADVFRHLAAGKQPALWKYLLYFFTCFFGKILERRLEQISLRKFPSRENIALFLTGRPEDCRRFLSELPDVSRSRVVVVLKEADRPLLKDCQCETINWNRRFLPLDFQKDIQAIFKKHNVHSAAILWNNPQGYGYGRMEEQLIKLFPGMRIMAFDTKNRLWLLKSDRLKRAISRFMD